MSNYRPDSSIGHYDACLSYQFEDANRWKLDSQHCLARVQANVGLLSFDWGVCLPSTCDWQDLQKIIKSVAPFFGFKFYWMRAAHQKSHFDVWGPWQMWVTTVIVVSGLLMALNTFLETFSLIPSSLNFTAFSLLRNGKAVFEQKDADLFGCFDGLKIFALLANVANNLIDEGLPIGAYNLSDKPDSDSLISLFVSYAAQFGNDALFFISGTLLSYEFFKQRQNG